MFPSEKECTKAWFNESEIVYNTDPNHDMQLDDGVKDVFKPANWQDDPENIINRDKMKKE